MDKYEGNERRENVFCLSHERQLNDVDDLKKKMSTISGWQKALSFFIVLCFVTVVSYASRTGVSVSKVQESVAKIDKQVATMVASDREFKQSTRRDIQEIKRKVEILERVKK